MALNTTIDVPEGLESQGIFKIWTQRPVSITHFKLFKQHFVSSSHIQISTLSSPRHQLTSINIAINSNEFPLQDPPRMPHRQAQTGKHDHHTLQNHERTFLVCKLPAKPARQLHTSIDTPHENEHRSRSQWETENVRTAKDASLFYSDRAIRNWHLMDAKCEFGAERGEEYQWSDLKNETRDHDMNAGPPFICRFWVCGEASTNWLENQW